MEFLGNNWLNLLYIQTIIGMKNLLLMLLIGIFAFSCKKSGPENQDPGVCGVNSVEELGWANALILNEGPCTVYSGAKLYAYTFNAEQVIYLRNPASSLYRCNQAVYNCSGISISDGWNAENWAAFETNRSNEKLLWEKTE